MNPNDPELLLRHLDGEGTPGERQRVLEMLRGDREARDFLREVAEQSVIVADLERTALGRRHKLASRAVESSSSIVPLWFRPWRWAAAAVLVGFAHLAVPILSNGKAGLVRVSKVTGSTQLLGSHGEDEHALKAGTRLRAGDTVETRSTDAWTELELSDGSTMTVAGHSALRILEDETGALRLRLLKGSLWASPAAPAVGKTLVIQTPTVELTAKGAQFDLHTCATETTVRVNAGSTRVKQTIDGSEVNVTGGNQVTASLDRLGSLVPSPQPKPVSFWACDLGLLPEVTLGRWLPPNATERVRLGAEPLLWPIPNRDPLLIHVAALSVLRSSDRPVLLRLGSKLVFRGRTERAQTVRFGFSTQKMRGAFAGKFEIDVRPEALGSAGGTWTVTLPLSDFRPLQPDLSPTPEGLELTDVYALTVKDDAGLEINQIELDPSP
jgi:hypothetical protein